jgi:hypothetical protein
VWPASGMKRYRQVRLPWISQPGLKMAKINYRSHKNSERKGEGGKTDPLPHGLQRVVFDKRTIGISFWLILVGCS